MATTTDKQIRNLTFAIIVVACMIGYLIFFQDTASDEKINAAVEEIKQSVPTQSAIQRIVAGEVEKLKDEQKVIDTEQDRERDELKNNDYKFNRRLGHVEKILGIKP